jgi:serine protease Do
MDEEKKYTGTEPNFVLLEEQREENDFGNKLYNDNPEERLYYDMSNQPSKKKRKGKPKGRKILSFILIILLSAGAGFGGGVAAMYYGNPYSEPSHMQAYSGITINTEDHVNTAEAVAAKVIPSVVGISTTTEVVRQNIFGMISGGLAEGVGTGIIVHEDGFILTNSHVVSDGKAKTITVQLTDGRELKGNVLWNDVTLDLAVVKIDAGNLTAAELGNSDQVNIGAYAVAIGNPLGLAFDRSVTQGVISGLNRTITVSDQNGNTNMEGLMQTDASINAGNSGGPLLNSKGQVIGINTAKAASGEGLGFAIPINTAKPIIEEVMETGTFSKAFIGIGGADAELYLQYYPQENLGTKTGVYISEIYSGSPAHLAGLKEGDVIVGIEGKKIETMEQLTRALFAYKPGDKVKLTLYRNAKKMEINVTLGTTRSQE